MHTTTMKDMYSALTQFRQQSVVSSINMVLIIVTKWCHRHICVDTLTETNIDTGFQSCLLTFHGTIEMQNCNWPTDACAAKWWWGMWFNCGERPFHLVSPPCTCKVTKNWCVTRQGGRFYDQNVHNHIFDFSLNYNALWICSHHILFLTSLCTGLFTFLIKPLLI